MRRYNKHTILFLLASFFILAQTALAQKEVDSILEIANKQVYENPDTAIMLAEKASNHSEVSVKNKISALLLISNAYSSKRDYKKSSEYVEQVKALLPKIKDDRHRMKILNRIASHYQELQIYDKAIDYLDEALILIKKYPAQDSIQHFFGYNAVMRGFIYREQMNCDIALTYFDKAIEAYKKTEKDFIRNPNLSICYYNKGNCLLTLKKTEEAKASYLSAIEYAKRADAKSLIAYGKKGLAEVKTLEGNYSEATSLLNNAIDISDSVGDLILDKGLYDGLSNNYLALNDWDNYTLYHNKFLSLQKKTKTSERKTVNQSLVNLTETKVKEIEELNKYYKPFQISLILFIVFALFILLRLILLEEKKLKELQKKLKN